LAQQEQKYLFRFIKERKAELYVLGITINIPQAGGMEERYSSVLQQINKLAPNKHTVFKQLRD